jgi:hypothetical protein
MVHTGPMLRDSPVFCNLSLYFLVNAGQLLYIERVDSTRWMPQVPRRSFPGMNTPFYSKDDMTIKAR